MNGTSPRDVIRDLFDALNQQNAEKAVRTLGDSYEGADVTRSSIIRSRAEARQKILAGLRAFDATFVIERCLSDSPHVAVYWRMDAVHEASFLQIPPSNEAVTVRGTSLFSVQGGKIIRGRHLWDLAGFLRAVHLLPDLPESPDTTQG